MLRSTNFWVGVLVGVAVPYLYQRYSMRKGQAS